MSRRRVALALATVLAAACGPREDVTPQIVVQPGAAERAMALTGKTETGPAPKPAATSSAPEAPAEGRLVFACMEPRGTLGALVRVPCLATVHRLDAPAGDAGEDDGDDDVLAPDGKIAMHLAPGRYRVTAARGLEHASAAFDVAVTAGQTTWGPHEGAVTIARVVDTKQYFAADLAVHAFAGDDARASAREWIATEAARGIEVVAPAEGVAPFDLEGLVREQKLEAAIVALAPRDFGVLDLGALEPASRNAALADYLARLAAKAPVTPVASGEARTYVRVDDDTVAAGDATRDAAREASFVRGVSELRDVVLTDGPFLRVVANGGGIGSVVRPRAGDVAVSVHVECVAGAHADRAFLHVAVFRARGGAADSRVVPLATMPSGAMSADVTLHVRAAKDDALVVVARDEASDGAFAMTGAIWIDADGDGESLGRKVGDIRPATSEKTTP